MYPRVRILKTFGRLRSKFMFIDNIFSWRSILFFIKRKSSFMNYFFHKNYVVYRKFSIYGPVGTNSCHQSVKIRQFLWNGVVIQSCVIEIDHVRGNYQSCMTWSLCLRASKHSQNKTPFYYITIVIVLYTWNTSLHIQTYKTCHQNTPKLLKMHPLRANIMRSVMNMSFNYILIFPKSNFQYKNDIYFQTEDTFSSLIYHCYIHLSILFIYEHSTHALY